MYGKELEQALRDHFQLEVKNIEPPYEWWENIISNLAERKRRVSWGFVPRTRLAWVLLPLILLLIAGTVYAASPLIREIFQKYAGHIEEAGLSQEINLSQTINGVTVNLERAYADSNVVLVGFTVSGPSTRYITQGDKLSTVDGQVLKAKGSMGFVPGSTRVMNNWLPTERVAVIEAFDTASLQGVSPELVLSFVIPVLDWTEPGLNAPVAGVFTFEFSVPFHSGQVIKVGQTVEAAGVSITLDEVLISPWETRAVLRFNPPYNAEECPSPIASLVLPNGKSVNEASGQVLEISYVTSFMGDYTNKPGEWLVVISELVFSPDLSQATPVPGYEGVYIGKASDTKRLAGPWIFRFQVP
jgi:hypothetical protein